MTTLEEVRDRVLASVEDHHPRIGVDISDSIWPECDCGWDETETKVDWHQHIVDAVVAKLAPATVMTGPDGSELRLSRADDGRISAFDARFPDPDAAGTAIHDETPSAE